MKERQKFYKLKLIWYRIKHGLILFSLQNLLFRLGIHVCPYFIDLESKDFADRPVLKDDPNEYSLKEVSESDIRRTFEVVGWTTEKLDQSFQQDHKCIGIVKGGEVAAVMTIQLESYVVRGRRFELQNNEAYLENMYTYEAHRGKNIAPYLRYLSYELLSEMGREVCYSSTDYLNRSSRRFKQKLGVRHHQLYLYLRIFKLFEHTFRLRSYETPQTVTSHKNSLISK